ncbi:hypothetical protein Hanom_Chr00s002079g01691591 [Helianthus anomalus]
MADVIASACLEGTPCASKLLTYNNIPFLKGNFQQSICQPNKLSLNLLMGKSSKGRWFHLQLTTNRFEIIVRQILTLLETKPALAPYVIS